VDAPYAILEITLGMLGIEEGHLLGQVCREWRRCYTSQYFNSYSSFDYIKTNMLTSRELQTILVKGGAQLHVRALKELIARDYRDQVKFFCSKLVLHAKVASMLFSP